jgi:outer membrane beta-barrel protein
MASSATLPFPTRLRDELMRRLVLLVAAAMTLAAPGVLYAQQPEPSVATTTKESNKDILVVPRKEVLKRRRVELAPFWGTTMNDPLIRHYVIGGQVNFFITDVLGLGLEYTEYFRQIGGLYSEVSPSYLVVPNANQYRRGAALNFQYIPVYGKFALFNRRIFSFEGKVGAGIGFIQTEIIPRRPFDESFTNYNIAPNVFIGGRFFFARWLSLHFEVKDYIFNDHFEPGRIGPNGTPLTIDQVKAAAPSGIVNNIVFNIGLSFWLPTDFEYKTVK